VNLDDAPSANSDCMSLRSTCHSQSMQEIGKGKEKNPNPNPKSDPMNEKQRNIKNNAS